MLNNNNNNNSHLDGVWDVDKFKNSSFMELALEGERRCKKGDCRAGVAFLEEAINKRDVIDKSDSRTLSAIYSQLGNAYFYLQEYAKAFEYHKLDLQIACQIKDKVGEAKASGNLGNTLKVLGKFEEAILCCERHLLLSKELGDRVGEGRAFYNLGNVYHAKGKQLGKDQVSPTEAGEFPPEVRDALTLATKYYRANLQIVLHLGDEAAQGRAYGNLGNTYHLLSNFENAIQCHKERQKIAFRLGDKAAERRAFSNMGNGYIFLGDYASAVEAYSQSLSVSTFLSDVAMEAQAAFSLGNTFMLMKDYDKATEYLTRHLKIARDLDDKVGESRALWCLSTALTSLDSIDIAIPYAQRHLEISREIGDKNGVEIATQSLQDLARRQREKSCSSSVSSSSSSTLESASVCRNDDDDDEDDEGGGGRRASSIVGDEDDDDNTAKPRVPPKTKATTKKRLPTKPSISGPTATTDQFFEYLSRVQGSRLDDQRCAFDVTSAAGAASKGAAAGGASFQRSSSSSSTSTSKKLESQISAEDQMLLQTLAGGVGSMPSTKNQEEFLDAVEKSNKLRFQDQRASLGRPCRSGSEEVDVFRHRRSEEDEFFSLLTRIQSSRIEDQRSDMPPPPPSSQRQQQQQQQQHALPRPQSSTGISSHSRGDVHVTFQHFLDQESHSSRSTPVDFGIFKRLPRLSKKKKSTRTE